MKECVRVTVGCAAVVSVKTFTVICSSRFPFCTRILRCADATVKLQLCAEQLSHVSDILPYIEFPEDGGPLTLDWMHTKLEELTMKKTRILNEKRTDNTKLAKHKESVLSELEKLRGLNRAHRKLMLEIWPHLTALARVSR